MTPLLRTGEKEIWADRLERPFTFRSPFDEDAFALLLVTGDVSFGDQVRTCEQIVRQNCRYAVCAGTECELWHDIIDETYLASDPNFQPPVDQHVETTWHPREPLSEVVWFFLNCTSFDSFIAERLLVLFIGANDAAEREVIETIASLTASERGIA